MGLIKLHPEQDFFFKSKHACVYLLHFDGQVGGRASHYIGVTTDLDRRLRDAYLHAQFSGLRRAL